MLFSERATLAFLAYWHRRRLGVLGGSGVVERRHIAVRVLMGELSVDGAIQVTRGVVPIAAAARRDGLAGILLPAGNASEAAIVSGLEVVAVSSLLDAVRALNDPSGPEKLPNNAPDSHTRRGPPSPPDLP